MEKTNFNSWISSGIPRNHGDNPFILDYIRNVLYNEHKARTAACNKNSTGFVQTVATNYSEMFESLFGLYKDPTSTGSSGSTIEFEINSAANNFKPKNYSVSIDSHLNKIPEGLYIKPIREIVETLLEKKISTSTIKELRLWNYFKECNIDIKALVEVYKYSTEEIVEMGLDFAYMRTMGLTLKNVCLNSKFDSTLESRLQFSMASIAKMSYGFKKKDLVELIQDCVDNSSASRPAFQTERIFYLIQKRPDYEALKLLGITYEDLRKNYGLVSCIQIAQFNFSLTEWKERGMTLQNLFDLTDNLDAEKLSEFGISESDVSKVYPDQIKAFKDLSLKTQVARNSDVIEQATVSSEKASPVKLDTTKATDSVKKLLYKKRTAVPQPN